jgi:hypothetical protein
MEQRRMQAADMFRRGVIPAEIEPGRRMLLLWDAALLNAAS